MYQVELHLNRDISAGTQHNHSRCTFTGSPLISLSPSLHAGSVMSHLFAFTVTSSLRCVRLRFPVVRMSSRRCLIALRLGRL